jgi:hypothetical protein
MSCQECERVLAPLGCTLRCAICGDLFPGAERVPTALPHAVVAVTCGLCGKPWALGQGHACSP